MRDFGDEETIFREIDVLNPNTKTYLPNDLPERKEELDQIHSALRPATMGSTPLNVLVYGHSGQGKTVGIELKTNQLRTYADNAGMDLSVITVRCKGLDKSYHVLTNIVKALREQRLGPGEELPSGYQRKTLLNMVLNELEKIGGTIIIVLDEIDAIGDDDYVLYELPRSNPEGVRLSIIGITNDLQFRDGLASDVRSSLGEDEVSFTPYDANELRDILSRRAVGALHDTYFINDIQTYQHLESDILEDDVIPHCAALAAQDTGDAREAIKLLFRAARFADDNAADKVTNAHVHQAREFLATKAVETGIQTLPAQKHLAVMSVCWYAIQNHTPVETTPLYKQYKVFAENETANILSNRRFRDRVNDLADTNILIKTQGRGRGVENKYQLALDLETVLENLPQNNERLGDTAESLRKRA
ncbi:Cdc6/Cdc18 family protein [Haloprofundus halophilus]|uniref:Cdc6/Cdc18 family protein n=1 Tax=Haloprofundus halophilus TaxID=2283527 RepID=UPI000E452DC9|nr:AAA family ATPase [Haloprofundus halophilus]